MQLAGVSGALDNVLGDRVVVPGGVRLRIRASAVTGKIVLTPSEPAPRRRRSRWWRRR